MDQTYSIKPIGVVKEISQGFQLQINKEFAPGLDGLQDFSHALVLWWAHHFDQEQDRNTVYAHPPHKCAPERLGVFATRSPIRPNPLAVTSVRIIKVDTQEGIVTVSHIDAEDGTPIIDIKPYQPSADRIREASVPNWCDHWPKWHEDSAEFDWEAEFNS